MSEQQPHPANAPGDFYVLDGCCTMCEVPFYEAPGLFGVASDGGSSHCFVQRQPVSESELDQMLQAIRCAELQCIRYRGTDANLQNKLIELGEGSVCDSLSQEQQAHARRVDEEFRRQRQPRTWFGRLRQWWDNL
jgi:hypothetical protein